MDIKLKYRVYVGEKHPDIASKLIDSDIERFTIEFSEHLLEQLRLLNVSSSLRFSEHEIDFAYLCGVFNVSGIDGLHNEIQRLKELGKEPHNIIEACRKQ